MEHKAQSLIVSVAVFIGLLFPLRFPDYFWYILAIVSVLSALSVFWVFNERPNLKRFKEDWFAIVFIFVFVSSLGLFAYTISHPLFQALILGSTGFFVYNILQVASRIKRNYTPSLVLKNIITLASMLAVFFTVSNVTKWIMVTEGGLERVASVLIVFVLVFIIAEFLFEVQSFERPLLYSLILSFVITQVFWLSSYWIVTYPRHEDAAIIGVPISSVMASVYFYVFWGLSCYRLEDKLTRKILWEYLFIALLFSIILIFTTQWLPPGY